MSTSTSNRAQTDEDELDIELTMPVTAGRLPRWFPWLTPLAALAVMGLLTAVAGTGLILWFVGSVVLTSIVTYVASRTVEGSRKATDRLVTVVVTSAFLLAMLPLISVSYTVITLGSERFDSEFFSFSMQGVVGAGGGAYHAIVGTLIITAITSLISIPIGILAAIYLVEYGTGRLRKAITFFVDVMTGIPSIVAGLFALALFTIFFGPGVRLGVMGAVALSVLMIPVVVRSTEEMLKLVPNELREASYALGVPKWLTILKIVLPTSLAGVATGVTLAIARVIGETAPLLITIGATTAVNFNPFEGRMSALPVFSYFSYQSPGIARDAAFDRAWAAALTLIIIVMALNLIARLISRLFAPKVRG